MMATTWALIDNGVVVNLTAWDDDTTASKIKDVLPQYEAIKITPQLVCAIGSYYNSVDGLFYTNSDFQQLVGWSKPLSVDDVHKSLLLAIQTNGNAIVRILRNNTGEEWWCQCEEAEKYTTDNAYVPVLLNAIVAASAGGRTLSELVRCINLDASEWKQNVGTILGEIERRIDELDILRAEVDSGAKMLVEMQSFNCDFSVPGI